MSAASIGVLVACMMLIGGAVLLGLNVRNIVGNAGDTFTCKHSHFKLVDTGIKEQVLRGSSGRNITQGLSPAELKS